MQYRILGSTGLRVSVIGLGTWQFGGEWGKTFTPEEVAAILGRGHELGINLLDTAECYGDHLSESLIGKAMAGRRSDWIVATKFGHKYHGVFQRTEPRSPEDVRTQLEESLRALRTDYIDLYQYHSWATPQFENDGVRQVLEDARHEGKIRHIGNSISPPDNLRQVELAGAYHVQAIQVVYNRLTRKAEEAVLPVCQRQNVGVLARVPLASGLLSGKYQPGARFDDPTDFRHRKKQQDIDDALRQVADIQRIELPPGIPLAQYALAWCLKHPAVSAVIPGCKSVQQVEANAEAGEHLSQ